MLRRFLLSRTFDGNLKQPYFLFLFFCLYKKGKGGNHENVTRFTSTNE